MVISIPSNSFFDIAFVSSMRMHIVLEDMYISVCILTYIYIYVNS